MSKENKKSKKVIAPNHQEAIDAYFLNGFNQVKAGLSIKPDMSYNSASVMMSSILKKESNQWYIKQKQDEIKAVVNIEHHQIVKELLCIAMGDVTEYIGLTTNQIKELPSSIKRCLSGIKVKTKRYKNREGIYVTEEQIEYKLKDSLKAFDMINKFIGLYSADNKQKTPKLNLENVNVENLNVLLQIVEQQKNLQ